MNVYVWRGKGVLPSYGTGLVVVAADNVEAARALARKTLCEQHFDWHMAVLFPNDSEYVDDEDRADLEEKLSFLKNDPDIMQNNSVVFLEGGG